MLKIWTFIQNQESSSEGNVVIETVNTSQGSEITSQNELEQIARNLNLQGELDPQTGIFYTVTNAAGQTETRRLTTEPKVVTESNPQGEATPGSKAYDLLSSSLAQAQIDLDPYQFIEEDVHVLTDKSPASSQASSGIVGKKRKEKKSQSWYVNICFSEYTCTKMIINYHLEMHKIS